MDIKKIIKENINKLLNEASFITGDSEQNPDFSPSPAPISGDRAAQRLAQVKNSLSDVEERMRKYGVYDLPELAGINTLEQLSIEPFRFTFIIQVPEDQQSLDLPDHIQLVTVSRVRQADPLILDFILENEQHGIPANDNSNPYSVEFTQNDELTVNLPGTNRNIRALQSETGRRKGRFYHVRFNMPPFNINEGEIIADDLIFEANGTVCGGKIKIGQKVTFKSGKHKGQLFTVTNKKGVKSGMVNIKRQSDNKSWAVECDKLIEHAKPVEEPNNNNTPNNRPNQSFESRIYAKDVELGPKAIKRRNADVRSYSNRNNGNNNSWDGLFTSLTTNGVPFNRVTLSNPNNGVNTQQLDNLINGNNRTIRLSQRPNNRFVINIGNSTVLEGEVVGNTNSFNFFNGGNVRIMANAGGLGLPQFECRIQITR